VLHLRELHTPPYCRKPIGPDDTLLEFADGNRVHLADGYDCLIRHGTRWRAAARGAVSQTAGAAPSSPVATKH
jgi:hypothetical protein